MLVGSLRKMLCLIVIDMLEKKDLLFINKDTAAKQGTLVFVMITDCDK